MTENTRYAIVIDGAVDNVVLWDGATEWQPPKGIAVACGDEVGCGWTYDAVTGFTAPFQN